MSAPRYAVFFCPADNSELGLYGLQVLGRKADGHVPDRAFANCPDRQLALALTKTPAHYGFHATLKAPFHLAEQATEQQLLESVKMLASRQSAIALHTLEPRLLSGFMALTLSPQPQAISSLAEQCVKQFEPFRAPLSAEDICKRNPAQLSEQQREYLYQYGYPYVMNEFRFHMTLTGKVSADQHAVHINWLSKLYDAQLTKTPVLDRLAVFRQPDRETAFSRLVEFAFN